jgi:3-phenylpropionate/trans-cinnamate dioxygenase ferredoxin reductase subunit
MDAEHIAIVGGGQAGAALACRLRAQGYADRITIFGEEQYPPYQRPPLSKKYLAGEWPVERMFLRPANFWREQGIEIMIGARVTEIDPARRTLIASGQEVRWTKLALTTGAAPRPLPDVFLNTRGVHLMRSMDDADGLKPGFVAGRRLLIVGGGYIGLETAAVAAEAGLSVTLIERAPRILERVACAETAAFFRDLHTRHSVTILEDRQVVTTSDDGIRTRVQLDDGSEMVVDLIVVGVGVAPRTSLATKAGIRCDNGIFVDGHCRTSAPDVWAAGDCTSFMHDGQLTRLESVPHAVNQAECVADDMLARSRTYSPVPWFWSDQYDAKLQIAGLSRQYDSTIQRQSGRGSSVWYFRDDRLIAVDAVNDARTFMSVRRALEAGKIVLRTAVDSPDFDPASLAR